MNEESTDIPLDERERAIYDKLKRGESVRVRFVPDGTLMTIHAERDICGRFGYGTIPEGRKRTRRHHYLSDAEIRAWCINIEEVPFPVMPKETARPPKLSPEDRARLRKVIGLDGIESE